MSETQITFTPKRARRRSPIPRARSFVCVVLLSGAFILLSIVFGGSQTPLEPEPVKITPLPPRSVEPFTTPDFDADNLFRLPSIPPSTLPIQTFDKIFTHPAQTFLLTFFFTFAILFIKHVKGFRIFLLKQTDQTNIYFRRQNFATKCHLWIVFPHFHKRGDDL